MPYQRIKIEAIEPYRPTEPKQVLAYRVSTETYDEVEMIARKMLKAWCEANPGTPATYVISGLSAEEMGERW